MRSLDSMIVYRLVCDQEHQFEGWFQSSDDYERQLGAGLLQCPACESDRVARLPSAPHVGIGRDASPEEPPREKPVELHKLLSLLQSITEDVGDRFSEEARKMHYREVPARSIRGRASIEAVEQLEQEGIEVLSLNRLSKLH
jgi:hypothetical protein